MNKITDDIRSKVEEYDKLRKIRNVHNTVLSLIKDMQKGKLLDMGCGNGILANDISCLGFDVSVCNYNIDIVSKVYPHLKCRSLDLNKDVPYADNKFDYVTVIGVVEHLENPWHLFREVNRILKDDGRFILSTPNIMNIWSRLRFLVGGNLQTFDRKKLASVVDPLDTGHITMVPLWLVKNMLRKIPFKIEKVTYNRAAFSYLMGYKFKAIQKFLVSLPRCHLLGEEFIVVMKKAIGTYVKK